MRDMSAQAKIISNEAFDRELDQANEVFDAESYTRDPNRFDSKVRRLKGCSSAVFFAPPESLLASAFSHIFVGQGSAILWLLPGFARLSGARSAQHTSSVKC
jgi:hypothetical protein